MTPPAAATTERRTCNLCGALVLEGQDRCRICGSVYEAPRKKSEMSNRVFLFIDSYFLQMMIALAGLAALGLLAYVIPARLAEGPGIRLLTVLGILFVASALLTMLDARQAALRNKDDDPLGAVRWFALTLVGWFVALPLYLQAREGDGLHTRKRNARLGTGVSILVGVLVVASLGTMMYRQREFRNEQLYLQSVVEKHLRKQQEGGARAGAENSGS